MSHNEGHIVARICVFTINELFESHSMAAAMTKGSNGLKHLLRQKDKALARRDWKIALRFY